MSDARCVFEGESAWGGNMRRNVLLTTDCWQRLRAVAETATSATDETCMDATNCIANSIFDGGGDFIVGVPYECRQAGTTDVIKIMAVVECGTEWSGTGDLFVVTSANPTTSGTDLPPSTPLPTAQQDLPSPTAESAPTNTSGNPISEPTETTGTSATTSESRLSTAALVGIGLASFVSMLLLIALARVIWKKLKRSPDDEAGLEAQQGNQYVKEGSEPLAHRLGFGRSPNLSLLNASVDMTKVPLWDDPEIALLDIPVKKISIGSRISRGGFGDVYRGKYDGEEVAIKRLLPTLRADARQINGFLEEGKMMAQLVHPCILRFIGIGRRSVTDIVIVSEFMKGGDLSKVLKKFSKERHTQGVNGVKLKIALHVAHALTYLHSLRPPMLHRDLKSKNVLLNEEFDAKVSDFGVSRERGDLTMTRGVGTTLWMAPEVMMGGRYDEKADVFSYGIMLSELDSNLSPYKKQFEEEGAAKKQDMMKKIAYGLVTVNFSYASHPSVIELGKKCISFNPTKRPTAAEVLEVIEEISNTN